MLGLIPKIAIQTLRREFDEELVQRVLVRSGFDPSISFRMGMAYSDESWRALLSASLEETGLERKEFLFKVSKEFLADARKRWTPWFEMASNSYDFLRIQPLIHASFATGTSTKEERHRVEDKFRIEEQSDNLLLVLYRSENQLCDLYLSLAQVFIESYGDKVEIKKSTCQRQGDDACRIELHFLELQKPSNPDLLRQKWTSFAPVSIK